YISSAGAGVFIWAIGESQDNRGNVVLMRPTPPVKEVFDLLGLSEMFEIKESLQESLKVFVATPPKTPGR
ncbi:MAG: STAS domain-containing protein, partial [Planctomycetes bacterium]|nr:STAS domain-containing protein [Planctomycetota bacterium]